MASQTWYTLVRFHGDPQHLTGVSQARTAQEALLLLQDWETAYPADTAVVFGTNNRPVERAQLEAWAAGQPPPPDQS